MLSHPLVLKSEFITLFWMVVQYQTSFVKFQLRVCLACHSCNVFVSFIPLWSINEKLRAILEVLGVLCHICRKMMRISFYIFNQHERASICIQRPQWYGIGIKHSYIYPYMVSWCYCKKKLILTIVENHTGQELKHYTELLSRFLSSPLSCEPFKLVLVVLHPQQQRVK